jgi:hypothetical protein
MIRILLADGYFLHKESGQYSRIVPGTRMITYLYINVQNYTSRYELVKTLFCMAVCLRIIIPVQMM